MGVSNESMFSSMHATQCTAILNLEVLFPEAKEVFLSLSTTLLSKTWGEICHLPALYKIQGLL